MTEQLVPEIEQELSLPIWQCLGFRAAGVYSPSQQRDFPTAARKLKSPATSAFSQPTSLVHLPGPGLDAR
jgi:hypothetical protein